MGDISDFIENVYLKDSDILEDKAKEISEELEKNILDQLWYPLHGYDTGQLFRDITVSHDTFDNFALIMGFYTVEYGQYWYRWKNWDEDKGFLELGVERTLELYR